MESKEKRRALIGRALGAEVLAVTDAIADLQETDPHVPAHLWRSLFRELARATGEIQDCPIHSHRTVYYRLRDAIWNRQYWHKDKWERERQRKQCLQ